MWIFGYGSLIWRPDFAYLERRRAYLPGFIRRFWQGSPDHRGVPGAPGRVATLLPAPGQLCGGCAYRIDPAEAEAILTSLDEREIAGFARVARDVFDSAESGSPFASALVYVANADNPHFLGPLDEKLIAEWVARSVGPSGPNTDYVVNLHAALLDLGIVDEHVELIAKHLRMPNKD